MAAPRSRAPLRIQNLRVNNIEIPNSKRIEISLQYIYGIGSTTAQAILRDTVRSGQTSSTQTSAPPRCWHASSHLGCCSMRSPGCWAWITPGTVEAVLLVLVQVAAACQGAVLEGGSGGHPAHEAVVTMMLAAGCRLLLPFAFFLMQKHTICSGV